MYVRTLPVFRDNTRPVVPPDVDLGGDSGGDGGGGEGEDRACTVHGHLRSLFRMTGANTRIVPPCCNHSQVHSNSERSTKFHRESTCPRWRSAVGGCTASALSPFIQLFLNLHRVCGVLQAVSSYF